MDYVVPIATLVTILVLPYLVNLCTTETISANAKRWVAIIVSLLVGVATGLIQGMPTAETLVTWVMACVGGVQIAYSAFKAIGVTSVWLDALQGVGSKVDTDETTD